FPGSNAKISTTTYNTGVTAWPASGPWMLQRYDSTSVQEVGRPEVFYRSVCIDSTTGFLKGRRTHLQNGAGYSAGDLVEVFDDVENLAHKGNLTTESYYPGTGQS